MEDLNREIQDARFAGEAGSDEVMQVLTFRLGDESFAFDIQKVREVLDFTTIRKVPQTADFMKGVINLRGNIAPVVDLRLKFGLPEGERTVDTCIIIVEVDFDGEEAVFGAIADSVEEVVSYTEAQLEAPPKMGTQLKTEFLKGMGRKGEHFTMILDINKVFSFKEITGEESEIAS